MLLVSLRNVRHCQNIPKNNDFLTIIIGISIGKLLAFPKLDECKTPVQARKVLELKIISLNIKKPRLSWANAVC